MAGVGKERDEAFGVPALVAQTAGVATPLGDETLRDRRVHVEKPRVLTISMGPPIKATGDKKRQGRHSGEGRNPLFFFERQANEDGPRSAPG